MINNELFIINQFNDNIEVFRDGKLYMEIKRKFNFLGVMTTFFFLNKENILESTYDIFFFTKYLKIKNQNLPKHLELHKEKKLFVLKVDDLSLILHRHYFKNPTYTIENFGVVMVEEEKYFILVLNLEIDCVDEELSNYDKWADNDPIRPDKAGQYKTFYKLILDYKKTDNKDLFRLNKFNSIAVVSERLKNILEKNSVKGIKYKLVTN